MLRIFELCDRRETVIPSAFELASDQAVIGINGVVLPARMRHLIAGLLQGELDLPQPFVTGLLAIGDQLQRRLEGQRRDGTQHLRRHRGIDTHVTEGGTPSLGRIMVAMEYFNQEPVVHTWTYKLNKAA
jgi:hypothetical protein